jgi:superfamily II DNA or RNA helicase
MTIEPRPYQATVIDKLEAASERRLMLVAPTGSGKTVIASKIIQDCGKHVLFLAHRRELIRQTRTHLESFDVQAGVILAGEPLDTMRGVQVASIQTLHSRCIRGSKDLPPAGLIFIDEAHHATARSYRAIVDRYPEAKIIGMTATPVRRTGRGLGTMFERLVECPQVGELIRQGYLVPTKVFAPSTPDLKGVHVRKGDYVESELDHVMNTHALVGDVVTHWHRLARRRKTVVFATSVGHSRHLEQEFRKSGVRVAHIDGSTPKEERDEILTRLSRGELDVVTNCMVLTEGWDQPDVACCVLARPTRSMGLYRQMVGRVIRPAAGKDHALILDHAGNTIQHGFVEDPIVWTLDATERAQNKTHEARDRKETSRLLECSQCQAIRTAGEPCPNCGFMPKRPAAYLAYREGDLAELGRDGSKLKVYSEQERRIWHRMLIGIALERGYKRGWAAYKFKEKFGGWPPRDESLTPITPNAEVRSWVRSRMIAFAKSQQRVAVNG